jgi:hypothetical protein
MFKCKYCKKEFEKELSLKIGHRCNKRYDVEKTIYERKREFIKNLYINDEYSITELCKIYGFLRKNLELFLKNDNIKIRSIHLHTNRSKELSKKKCLEKYGVDNISKLETNREKMKEWNKQAYSNNGDLKIKYDWMMYISDKSVNPMLKEQFELYKEKVLQITKKEKKKLDFNGKCYYTGVEIHDNINKLNNHYLSIDHKISILHGFEKGLSYEFIGSSENLCYCSRICNSIKREMDEDEFKNSQCFRRLLEYESLQGN